EEAASPTTEDASAVEPIDEDDTKKRKAEDMDTETPATAAEKEETKPELKSDDTAEAKKQPNKKQKLSDDHGDQEPPSEEKKDDTTRTAAQDPQDDKMEVEETDTAEKGDGETSGGENEDSKDNATSAAATTSESGKVEAAMDTNTSEAAPTKDGVETEAPATDATTVKPAAPAQKPSAPATIPAQPKGNPYDALKYTMIANDGKPDSLIKLVALKSLFSKQLPKMPRAYIARLVFDRRHVSLAILNDSPDVRDTDEEVIGAICYRPFYDMRFAEIAFCAVNASHQVKGYGTKLMNLVKREGARTGIEFFITYADNYAIGYFKKQGFSKSIQMPRGRYQGLIKDYDGGTMMECYVHPSIDFTRIPEMLAKQRQFILGRIRLQAKSTKVYDPLPKDWKPDLEGVSRGNDAAARALAIPGMVEAGWTMADLVSATGQGKDLDRAKNALKSELLGMVRKVEEQQFSWPFREPVDTSEVNDYLEVIKEPIDLSTIDKRIRKGEHYKSKKMLYADLMLMVNNCKLYNEEASTYMQCAKNLEDYLKGMFANL
ncbi:MAG: hypothetical protein SGILL_007639, partial [Bacillariaceae sp.]